MCLNTFSDDSKNLLQVSRQTKCEVIYVKFNSFQSHFFMERLQVFPKNISEFSDKVSGKRQNP